MNLVLLIAGIIAAVGLVLSGAGFITYFVETNKGTIQNKWWIPALIFSGLFLVIIALLMFVFEMFFISRSQKLISRTNKNEENKDVFGVKTNESIKSGSARELYEIF